jgi:transposase-like protein
MEGIESKPKHSLTIQRLLESSYGDLHQVIPLLTNELGQSETAKRLNVSQTFISRWLRNHGYSQKWIKSDEDTKSA